MNVSSVKNLNGETFSAVQDASLTNVVQTNSGNWQDITAYQTKSGTYLTAHQDLSNYATTGDLNTASGILSGAIDYLSGNVGKTYTGISPIVVNNTTNEISADSFDLTIGSGLAFENNTLYVSAVHDAALTEVVQTNSGVWNDVSAYQTNSATINDVNSTVQTNSAQWAESGSIDTIPVVAISPLVTGFSGESAYLGIESTALNLSSYVPVSSIGYNGSYISTISGRSISSYTGRYAMTANYANTADIAYRDRNYREITSYYQPKLTIAGSAGSITSINGSAVGATIPEGWELVGSAGISIVDDAENNQTIISVTGGGGDAEVNDYVHNNSATINDVNSTVQTNSASWAGGGTILSGDVISGKFASRYGNIVTNTAISSINGSGFGVLPVGTVLQNGIGGGLMQFGTTSNKPVFVAGGGAAYPSDNAWSTGNILILSGTQGQGYYKGHQLFLSTNNKAAITFDANARTTGDNAQVKIYSYSASNKYVGLTTSSIKINDGSDNVSMGTQGISGSRFAANKNCVSGIDDFGFIYKYTYEEDNAIRSYSADINYISGAIGNVETLLASL